MASTLVHDLQQFRYVTAFTCPVPWTHVRHVSIPELRHEAPDLPFMASLISALSDCDVSLHEIHDHNDADILQLVQVLQVCLQFSLWSQNILKEKLLEVQATHVAKGVSAQQLENLERRYHALEGEMAALHKDRDMLSLAPRLPPPRESQQRSAGNRHASAPTHRTKKAATVYHSSRLPTGNADAHRDSTASLTSDTSYGDSCLSAEVAARAHSHVPQPCGSVDPPPPPFLDWRTLVRYIIHEEQRTSAWTSTHASPTAARATADERRIERKAELMPAAQHPSEPAAALPAAATPQVSEAQLDSFFAGLTAGVTTEVVAYSRAVAARAEEMVRAATQQRMQETAEAQQALMAQVQTALGSLSAELAAYKQQKDATPSPDLRAVAMPVAASGASDPHAQLSPFSPVLALSNVRNSAAAALPAPSRHASSAPVTLNNAPPTNDSKPLSQPPQASASPLPPSIDSSPPASFLNSFVTSGAALCHSTRGREALDSGSKTRKPLPDFSPDILRTPPTSEHGDAAAPSGAGSDGPRSVVSRADDEDERDVDVDLLPLDSSSSDSSSGSSQSSDGKADGVAEVSHAYPRVLAKPSSAPPMYPNKTPTAAAVVVQPAAPQHPSANRTLSLHFSTRSDMSEGSSHGSSQMLRETRTQLQALLEEEEAAGRAKTHR
ncbi:Myotubularin-associated family protein [Leishmania donovani]|uniref:Myotubularin-associated family protein n=1 Tax=Leishmania donovani TaxID=5661 RepID=A0A504WVF2_LEIDO|nr:Myotubularin-associated family protein [Leishmania donovani]